MKRRRVRKQHSAKQVTNIMDGWTAPAIEEVDPQPYPWEVEIE